MSSLSPEQAAEQSRGAAAAARQAAEAAERAALQAESIADRIAEGATVVTNGAVDPTVFRLAIFVLAIFVGYYVVWSVTPALHTPLMAVTNAISSVIIVGALIASASMTGDATGPSAWVSKGAGVMAAALASVNICEDSRSQRRRRSVPLPALPRGDLLGLRQRRVRLRR